MNVNYNGKFRYNAGEFCANFDFMYFKFSR